jgi:1-acyl-sn-glycerol-3-phosphate acyltransferase
MYYLTRSLHKSYTALSGKKRIVSGIENIPEYGPLMIASNHNERSDPWVVSGVVPFTIHWISKIELFSFKTMFYEARGEGHSVLYSVISAFLTKFVVRHSKTIPFDRNNKLNRVNGKAKVEMKNIFSAGGCVGIFPQGTRKNDPKAKSSFLILAKKQGVGVLIIKTGRNFITISPLITAEEISAIPYSVLKDMTIKILEYLSSPSEEIFSFSGCECTGTS